MICLSHTSEEHVLDTEHSLLQHVSQQQHEDRHGQRIEQVTVVGVLHAVVRLQVRPFRVGRQPDVRRPERVREPPKKHRRNVRALVYCVYYSGATTSDGRPSAPLIAIILLLFITVRRARQPASHGSPGTIEYGRKSYRGSEAIGTASEIEISRIIGQKMRCTLWAVKITTHARTHTQYTPPPRPTRG